jgi:hypothetical protein
MGVVMGALEFGFTKLRKRAKKAARGVKVY